MAAGLGGLYQQKCALGADHVVLTRTLSGISCLNSKTCMPLSPAVTGFEIPETDIIDYLPFGGMNGKRRTGCIVPLNLTVFGFPSPARLRGLTHPGIFFLTRLPWGLQ